MPRTKKIRVPITVEGDDMNPIGWAMIDPTKYERAVSTLKQRRFLGHGAEGRTYFAPVMWIPNDGSAPSLVGIDILDAGNLYAWETMMRTKDDEHS